MARRSSRAVRRSSSPSVAFADLAGEALIGVPRAGLAIDAIDGIGDVEQFGAGAFAAQEHLPIFQGGHIREAVEVEEQLARYECADHGPVDDVEGAAVVQDTRRLRLRDESGFAACELDLLDDVDVL